MLRCSCVALTALLLAGGCASSGPNPHAMSVEVVEYVSPNQQPVEAGSRLFEIRIENKSQMSFTVHSISVQAGSSDYEMDAPPEDVETAIAPDERQSFQIFANVGRVPRSGGGFAMDSLRLTMECTDENGADFFESGTYSIRRQAAR